MSELNWIRNARTKIGLKEIKGVLNEPLIVRMWKLIKRGGIKTDEVPWCAAFVGSCLEEVGIVSSRFESALSYLTWGIPLLAPLYGCIVVFKRDGGGHVGFLVGQDHTGNLMILGGNQGDQVCIKPFSITRVAAFRWPTKAPISFADLPLISSNAPLSNDEA